MQLLKARPVSIIKKTTFRNHRFTYFNFFVLERESFDEYKRRMNITNIPPPESSTSGSDSDDERLIGYD